MIRWLRKVLHKNESLPNPQWMCVVHNVGGRRLGGR